MNVYCTTVPGDNLRLPCSVSATLFFRIIEAGDKWHLYRRSYPHQKNTVTKLTFYLKKLNPDLSTSSALVYTVSNCGRKWVEVGNYTILTLHFWTKMGQREQVF